MRSTWQRIGDAVRAITLAEVAVIILVVQSIYIHQLWADREQWAAELAQRPTRAEIADTIPANVLDDLDRVDLDPSPAPSPAAEAPAPIIPRGDSVDYPGCDYPGADFFGLGIPTITVTSGWIRKKVGASPSSGDMFPSPFSRGSPGPLCG